MYKYLVDQHLVLRTLYNISIKKILKVWKFCKICIWCENVIGECNNLAETCFQKLSNIWKNQTLDWVHPKTNQLQKAIKYKTKE